MSNSILAISSLIYFQLNWLVLNRIDESVHKPYMDEIFHIPQAQQYCAGNYTKWNDKITTLPGLYYLSSTAIRLIALLLSEQDIMNVCNVYNLRFTNIILASFNFMIIYKIMVLTTKSKKQNTQEPLSRVLILFNALALSLFPLNHFFQYLYYTDIGSSFFILFAYYQLLKRNYKISGLSGGIAILFRQTNIIWVVFCMFELMLSNAYNIVKRQESKKLIKQCSETGQLSVTQQRFKKPSNCFELISKTPTEAFQSRFDYKKFLTKLYREDFWGKKLVYYDLYQCFDFTKPYLLVVMKFLIFIYINNGIVVGDRSNHKATVHISQIFYFVSFSTFFSLATILFSYKKLRNLFFFLKNNFQIIIVVMIPILLVIVKNFTFEHKFLLSDNRHFTFYIWSKFFRKYELSRYLVTPLYIAGIYLFYQNLASNGKTLGWIISYLVCLFAALVPQELLEFRYFIIPYFIYRLNITKLEWKQVLFEIGFNLLINCLTIYIFLDKPFIWSNEPEEKQRFMW